MSELLNSAHDFFGYVFRLYVKTAVVVKSAFFIAVYGAWAAREVGALHDVGLALPIAEESGIRVCRSPYRYDPYAVE